MKRLFPGFVFAVVVTLLLLSGTGLCAQDSENTETQPAVLVEPFVGQELVRVKAEYAAKTAKLDAEIAAVSRKLDQSSSGMQILSGVLMNYVNKNGVIPFVVIACFWVGMLLLMYSREEEQTFRARKPLLLKLLYCLLALGLLAVLTGVASAGTERTFHPPQNELPATLEYARQASAMEPRQRVLEALEEHNCQRIDIPQDVYRWLKQNCRSAEILSTIDGQGPHRLAAIAAFYWSEGNKAHALNVLRPLLNDRFMPRLLQSESGFKTAVGLFADANESETAVKFARKIMDSLDTPGLVWLAKILRGCCIETAMECLDRAKRAARTANDVVFIARVLREFARPDDASKFITSKLDMTIDINAMKLFLQFAKEAQLADIEQTILSWNINRRDVPARLIDLAMAFIELGYTSSAKRAVEKALEKDNSSSGLIRIASVALQWGMYDVAQTSLKKVIDIDGFSGAALEFPDPMLLPVSAEKPVAINPSVGVAIGIISEKLNDKDTAQIYYTEALNLEIYNKYRCMGSAHDINFANFFYPYRFYIAQANVSILQQLVPIGQELEEYLVAGFVESAEKGVRERQQKLDKLKKDLWQQRYKNTMRAVFKIVLSLFVLFVAGVLIASQVYAVKKMRAWVNGLDRHKTLGGFLKLCELEGFILLPSIIASLIGFAVIVLGQFFMGIMLTEAHTSKVSEHFNSGKS